MKYFRNLLLPIVALVSTSGAAGLVKLSTDKSEYIQYSPIYLTMELLPGNGIEVPFGPLEDENSPKLRITYPDGRRILYRPPLRFCMPTKEEHHQVEYSTLILEGGDIITSLVGTFTLELMSTEAEPVSNTLKVKVKEAESVEDKIAVNLIRPQSSDYAAFLYLEGGDHIGNGKALQLVEKLAATSSSFAQASKAVLAMNYSQVSFDWAAGKVRRKVSPEKVEAYFPNPADNTPEYLKLKTAFTVSNHMKPDEIPYQVSLRMGELAKNSRYNNSRIGKNIKGR